MFLGIRLHPKTLAPLVPCRSLPFLAKSYRAKIRFIINSCKVMTNNMKFSFRLQCHHLALLGYFHTLLTCFTPRFCLSYRRLKKDFFRRRWLCKCKINHLHSSKSSCRKNTKGNVFILFHSLLGCVRMWAKSLFLRNLQPLSYAKFKEHCKWAKK